MVARLPTRNSAPWIGFFAQQQRRTPRPRPAAASTAKVTGAIAASDGRSAGIGTGDVGTPFGPGRLERQQHLLRVDHAAAAVRRRTRGSRCPCGWRPRGTPRRSSRRTRTCRGRCRSARGPSRFPGSGARWPRCRCSGPGTPSRTSCTPRSAGSRPPGGPGGAGCAAAASTGAARPGTGWSPRPRASFTPRRVQGVAPHVAEEVARRSAPARPAPRPRRSAGGRSGRFGARVHRAGRAGVAGEPCSASRTRGATSPVTTMFRIDSGNEPEPAEPHGLVVAEARQRPADQHEEPDHHRRP